MWSDSSLLFVGTFGHLRFHNVVFLSCQSPSFLVCATFACNSFSSTYVRQGDLVSSRWTRYTYVRTSVHTKRKEVCVSIETAVITPIFRQRDHISCRRLTIQSGNGNRTKPQVTREPFVATLMCVFSSMFSCSKLQFPRQMVADSLREKKQAVWPKKDADGSPFQAIQGGKLSAK